jgi:hypothetical protein
MVTEQGYGMGIGGCNKLCLVAMRHSLVALFSLSILIKDRPVIDLLSWAHICLWEREGSLLSCRGFRLFLDRLIGGGDRWRSKHRTEAGS